MGKFAFLTALSTLTAQFIPLVYAPMAIAATIYRMSAGPKANPVIWAFASLYLAFMIWDRKTPSINPRTSTVARSLGLWDHGREYFHGQFHQQTPLRNDRTYLFAMHPHSVLCFAVWVNYVSNKKAFPELRHTRLATISSNFTTPYLRDIMMSLGFIPATKSALTTCLKTDQSTGLIIGGASEAQHNSHRAVRLMLHTRLGFLRIALEADSPVLIVFHFNEIGTFKMPFEPTVADATSATTKPDSLSQKLTDKVLNFQAWFLNTFSFSLPIATGLCGPLPYPRDVVTMTGDYPLDMRVLVEFYFYLVKNNLYLGFTPQCPLDLLNLPHSHHTPTARHVPYKYPHCQHCSHSHPSSFVTKTSPISTPPSHTLIDSPPFPIEYSIQQSTRQDYFELLKSAPESKKKRELLNKYQKYTEQLQAQAQQQQQQQQQQHSTQSAEKSSKRSSKQPTTVRPVVNKPCFLEEILLIPILPTTSSSQSPPQPIPVDVSPYLTQEDPQPASQPDATQDNQVTYDDIAMKWSDVPTTIVKWLLLIYIGELSYFYYKYNTHQIPLEIVDFDFPKWCIETCGLKDADIPFDVRAKYRYGINLHEYLTLHGYNRTYFIEQLRNFLLLKQNPIPISLDGNSDVPYPAQPAQL